MDDKLFKATKLAKKHLVAETGKVSDIKKKQASGEKLTFAEKNILNIYENKLQKTIKRSLK